jgi:photosystem II stability/assembly factor-like uncharacterized protein
MKVKSLVNKVAFAVGMFPFFYYLSNAWLTDPSNVVHQNSFVQAEIIGEKNKGWETNYFKLPFLAVQSGIFFIDESIGFILGKDGLLHQTRDGGKTWEIVLLDETKGIHGASMSFKGHHLGLLSASIKGTATSSHPNDIKRIWSTIDSGMHWTPLRSTIEMMASDLVRLDERRSWFYNPKIYFTYDAGKTWHDRSDNLLRAANSPLPLLNYFGILGLINISHSEAWVLTNNDHILKTKDDGVTWETVAKAPLRLNSSFCRLVGYLQDRPVIVASGGSHGIYTDLLIMKGDSSFLSYFRPDVQITSVKVLPDQGLIMSGSLFKQVENSNPQPIILETSKDGKTWKIIYDSQDGQPLTISVPDSNHIWVLSQDNALIKLSRISNER